MKVLVSRCLLGENCKYNGGNNYDKLINEFLKEHDVIPVCPEVLGGLPTPRHPSEIVNDVVINDIGENVDEKFRRGAKIALEIAQKENVDIAILQSRSPSCGIYEIYDGTFSGHKIKGQGIFARLMAKENCLLLDREEFADALSYRLQKATADMSDEILAFYHSMVGTPYCAWNMNYPGMIEIENDIKNSSLYYCKDENGIVATVSIDTTTPPEVFENFSISNAAEISRLAIRNDMRNKGLAKKILLQLFVELKAGFAPCGNTHFDDMDFICMERSL